MLKSFTIGLVMFKKKILCPPQLSAVWGGGGGGREAPA